MSKSRSQKSMINIMVMIVYEVVVMICGLILPRLILVSFGSSYNGMTASITQFLSFIAILRAGVAGSSRVALYKTLADGDNNYTSRILRATEIYLRKVAYVFIGYLLCMAIFYKAISGTEVSWINSFSLVVIIGLGTFAQYYFGLTYHTLLTADQKNYIYYMIQIVATIINTCIAALLIKLGSSIHLVKLGSAIVFVVSPLFLNWYVSKKYNIDKKCEPDNTALAKRWDVMGIAIANIIHDNTDIIILTLFTNVRMVSVYTIYNLVINGLKKILAVFTTGTEAAFGNMWAKGEKDIISRNLGVLELLVYSFVSIAFSTTIVMILPFVDLYTLGITDIEYNQPVYAYIAVISTAFYCFRMPYMTLVQAAGHYKETRNGSFVEAIINVCVSICLVGKLSIVGVVIGTLIADCFRTIQYMLYCCKHLVDRKWSEVVFRFLWTICNIIIVIVIYKQYGVNIKIESWLEWIVQAVVVTSMASIITLISACVFYITDIKALSKIVRRLL